MKTGVVGKNDFENAFNSLSRQKMLNTHCSLFPESTDVFNSFMVLILLFFY